ncbi:MAG TPA: pyridoxal-phosphate dependent enzyme, partial [Chitinophagaceae bacterium]|nr:pyridoxal-phosphate dependent enzyme [Chitinophagaceae bacterium]
FKLQFYIQDAISKNKKNIVTFGGAYSNHILATAASCRLFGLKSFGIIRGEEPANYSPTLLESGKLGMQFSFTTRADYAKKLIPSTYLNEDYYIINEGGFGELGVQGAETISNHFTQQNYTHILCAVGTGTMMAGLIRSSLPKQEIIGISILKGNDSIYQSIRGLVGEEERTFTVLHDYHFGGYARYTNHLIGFMNEFFAHSGIPSDFVYTGKLFMAANDLLQKYYFPPQSKILLIHSGGLQGNQSLKKGTLSF